MTVPEVDPLDAIRARVAREEHGDEFEDRVVLLGLVDRLQKRVAELEDSEAVLARSSIRHDGERQTAEALVDQQREEIERLKYRLASMNECVRIYVDMRDRETPARPGWLEEEVSATDAVLDALVVPSQEERG